MKRYSRTVAQQCRYYEVNNIFEYMVETYLNGNITTFGELYRELCKDKLTTDFRFLALYNCRLHRQGRQIKLIHLLNVQFVRTGGYTYHTDKHECNNKQCFYHLFHTH